uniref:Uncharacterized protein n=1 Tax=Candidatus Kentrum sp. UNK TaxID=2126344 RepID=A0A451AU87_9GAMM|nr:MAG: hypothetical protein BECKUNK1418G_GA0071005_101321 [Candidatus Kentron sp. UNK]VFK69467.1 MAG: hypothetical protein BECKUNK1418H_GA0071006_101421 [Candidatus Kentron sp. UNK]
MLKKISKLAPGRFNYPHCLTLLTAIAMTGCATKIDQEHIKPQPQVDMLEVQLTNFQRDLNEFGSGCVIHSVSLDSPALPDRILRSVANRLRQSNHAFTLISGRKAASSRLSRQLRMSYSQAGLTLRVRDAAPGELSPPYDSLCRDIGKLYIADEGVGYASRFKSKDQGITSILVVSSTSPYDIPEKNRRYEHDHSIPRGSAGKYYDRHIK